VPHFFFFEQRQAELPVQRDLLDTPPTLLAWMPEQTFLGTTHVPLVHSQESLLRQAFFP